MLQVHILSASSIAIVQDSTTNDTLAEEALLEELSGLVHAITPSIQPLVKVASAEKPSDAEGDSDAEDEALNGTQTLDPVSTLRTSLAELLSGIKQRLHTSCTSHSQLRQVLLANCSTAEVDTDGEERDWVTRIFDRLKKAENTAKGLSER